MKTYQQFMLEAGDWWHPDPKKDAAISGAGNKMRAREDRGQDTSAQTKPDYSNRLKPGETYLQYDKRKQAERMQKRMQKEEVDLSETSLSRIVSKIRKGGVATVSAERGDKSKAENKKRSKQLEKDIRGRGMGMTKARGSFVEVDDDGKRREVGEKSYIVTPGKKGKRKFKKAVSALGKKHDQDSVLIKQKPGLKSKASWLGTTKRKDAEPKMGKTSPQGTLKTKDANKPLPGGEGGTKIKNKTYQFK